MPPWGSAQWPPPAATGWLPARTPATPVAAVPASIPPAHPAMIPRPKRAHLEMLIRGKGKEGGLWCDGLKRPAPRPLLGRNDCASPAMPRLAAQPEQRPSADQQLNVRPRSPRRGRTRRGCSESKPCKNAIPNSMDWTQPALERHRPQELASRRGDRRRIVLAAARQPFPRLGYI